MRLNLEPPTRTLLFDEMRIEQVLVNLLDNASRFTPRDGSIEIRSCSVFWDRRGSNMTGDVGRPERRQSRSQEYNAYRVEVRDSGRGVPPSDLEWIFEEYSTAAKNYDSSRAGLGLTICRQFINAHGGAMFAESSGPGGCFVFVLPYGEATGPASALKLSAGTIVD
jgi:signal transduction histidine kinase